MNSYMKERYERRRKEAVLFLGGRCIECGSTDDLEFDHKDPVSKFKTIARLSSASEKIFKEELSKCQLLCYECHLKKTKIEVRNKWSCLGIEYETYRDMAKKTGLAGNTIIKYTCDGFFDVEKYRNMCHKQGRKPKI